LVPVACPEFSSRGSTRAYNSDGKEETDEEGGGGKKKCEEGVRCEEFLPGPGVKKAKQGDSRSRILTFAARIRKGQRTRKKETRKDPRRKPAQGGKNWEN